MRPNTGTNNRRLLELCRVLANAHTMLQAQATCPVSSALPDAAERQARLQAEVNRLVARVAAEYERVYVSKEVALG
jgi:hypothetical protein